VIADQYPPDVLYSEDHDWARVCEAEATFGLTWYAQDALGTIVFWEAPKVGASVVRGQSYAEVESVKAVSDVIAPLSGEILEVNRTLQASPETLNSDPYGEGWLVRVRLGIRSEVGTLLNAAAYKKLVGNG
jgi:glycine cleavage system H protein